jgi:hypothetical protein
MAEKTELDPVFPLPLALLIDAPPPPTVTVYERVGLSVVVPVK